jgi:hypothetical protein
LKRICSIYQSSKRSGMYLYVLKSDALERVPDALMTAFGKAKHSFDLVLSPERKLASEDINAAGRGRVHRAPARRVAATQRPGLTREALSWASVNPGTVFTAMAGPNPAAVCTVCERFEDARSDC